MREAVRHNPPGRFFLQTVVTDSGGGIQGLFQVARLENTVPLHVIAPDAGKAVSLKLNLDGNPIGVRLGSLALQFLSLFTDAEKILYVVPDLVREHVTQREVTAAAEFLLHILVEREIDIDLLVSRAVEGAHRALAITAGGRCGSRVKNQFGRCVAASGLLENFAPGIFRCLQSDPGEIRELLFFSGRLVIGGRRGGRGLSRCSAVQKRCKVDAVVTRHEHDDKKQNAAFSSNRRETAASA